MVYLWDDWLSAWFQPNIEIWSIVNMDAITLYCSEAIFLILTRLHLVKQLKFRVLTMAANLPSKQWSCGSLAAGNEGLLKCKDERRAQIEAQKKARLAPL